MHAVPTCITYLANGAKLTPGAKVINSANLLSGKCEDTEVN